VQGVDNWKVEVSSVGRRVRKGVMQRAGGGWWAVALSLDGFEVVAETRAMLEPAPLDGLRIGFTMRAPA
jgi:hypothetical protein